MRIYGWSCTTYVSITQDLGQEFLGIGLRSSKRTVPAKQKSTRRGKSIRRVNTNVLGRWYGYQSKLQGGISLQQLLQTFLPHLSKYFVKFEKISLHYKKTSMQRKRIKCWKFVTDRIPTRCNFQESFYEGELKMPESLIASYAKIAVSCYCDYL